jgi:hypothetical protein
MSDARHHHAPRDRVQIVFVPIEIGSPKQATHPKPPAYPRQGKEAWQPRTRPPSRAEKVANFLDSMNRNDQAAREFMDECRRISAERRREQVSP